MKMGNRDSLEKFEDGLGKDKKLGDQVEKVKKKYFITNACHCAFLLTPRGGIL